MVCVSIGDNCLDVPRLCQDVGQCATWHSVDGIRNGFAARCIMLKIMHSVLLEAAVAQHIDLMWTGFAHVVRTVLAFSSALACEPVGGLPQIYRAMVAGIAHHIVPECPGEIGAAKGPPRTQTQPLIGKARDEWKA